MFRGHDAQGAEARKSARAPSSLEGKIFLSDGTAVACKIKDLSATGARIQVQDNAKLPETFHLVIFEVKFRVSVARLQWRKGNLVGVSFASDKPAQPSRARLP